MPVSFMAWPTRRVTGKWQPSVESWLSDHNLVKLTGPKASQQHLLCIDLWLALGMAACLRTLGNGYIYAHGIAVHLDYCFIGNHSALCNSSVVSHSPLLPGSPNAKFLRPFFRNRNTDAGLRT